MLDMNDVLAPYVSDSYASLGKWLANYSALLGTLIRQLKPATVALATVTPQADDPATPVNQVLAAQQPRARTAALARLQNHRGGSHAPRVR